MNSHYPRFSPDGSLIASGAGEIFLRDAVHGVDIRSLGYGHQPTWFTENHVLVKGKDSHDDRPYLLNVTTGTCSAPLSDLVAAAYTAGGGKWFATEGERIAVAVSREGQRAWITEHHGDNNDHSLYLERMVGEGAGRRLERVAVMEHQSVHRPRVEDGYLVWTLYPGDRRPQEVWGLRPGRTTPECLRTLSEGAEDGAVPILTPEGPWLLFQTNTDLRARPWDSFDGHIIPTGEDQNFNPDGICVGRELRFVWNTKNGAIPPQQAAISLDAPRVDTRLGSAGVPGVPTEVIPTEVIPTEAGARLKKPEVSVDRWTLEELTDGREMVFLDRENPAPGYRFRVFVRDGSLFAEIANAAGVGVTGARRPVKPPRPAAPTPPPPPEPAPSSPEAVCRLIWREELEREIDPSGLASCVQALAAGQSADAIRAGVRQSDEYRDLQERKRHTPR